MSISSNDSDGYSPHSRNTCALEVWEPISFLGDGSIATVHLARRRPQRVKIPYIERSDIMTRAMKASGQSHGAIDSGSGGPSASVVQVCALKSIHQDHVGSNTILRDAKDEISILRKLSHPNIVRLLEGFERRRHVYMATEVCQGGDLHQVEGTSEAQAKAIVRQILSAVSYMHQMGVVHRDLKLANVLFANKDQKEVKIIDFGMAVEHKNGSEKLSKRVGTIYSMAPEVLKGSYDCKCDMVRMSVALGAWELVLARKGIETYCYVCILLCSGPWVSLLTSFFVDPSLSGVPMSIFLGPKEGTPWQAKFTANVCFVVSVIVGLTEIILLS